MSEDVNIKKIIRILKNVASELGGDFREDYSGRGMYGKECYGVVCENDTECIELAASMGLSGAKVDNMGLKYIIYYPNPKLEDVDEEE